MRDEAAAAVRRLNEVVEQLRAPGGCPWDREQTHRTLRPYLLEETYELLEAIDSGDPERLREELGDLLLQALMHSAIAQEDENGFDIGDVAEVVTAKMIHRHPHVFGDVRVDGAADVVVNWERLKTTEKRERVSLLEGVPRSLPALAYAQGVQKRPARVGFDETPSVRDALDNVRATLDRVAELAEHAPRLAPRGRDWSVSEGEISQRSQAGHPPPPPPATPELEAALGALLFATVGLARQLRVNPEDALREQAAAFAERFRRLETKARGDHVDLHELDADQWRKRWEESRA